MLKFRFLIVLTTLVALSYGADTINANVPASIGNGTGGMFPPEPPSANVTTPEPPKPPTSKPTSTTTVKPPITTPKPITTVPPTTKPTTKPTTPEPITTVPTTKPTTPAPTTKPTTTPEPTTKSTTVAPITVPTTTTPPKPKPQPQPINPDTGSWRVNYTNPSNITCILANMALQIEVPYMTKSNKTEHGYVDVPKNATSSGYCSNTYQNITIQWKCGNLTMGFLMANGKYGLTKFEIMLTLDSDHFPNIKDDNSTMTLEHKKEEFEVAAAKSYKCDKLKTLNLTRTGDASNATVAFIHLSHLQVQAYYNITSNNFADAVDCEPSGTPDIVPIAVGCALAALVIIVLVAYLIGRRRSQARGYLSMFTQNKKEEDYIPMKNLSCFN